MSLSHPTPTSILSWLSNLKATQLHRIAVATGIQSSGTKVVLAQRLSHELQKPISGGQLDVFKKSDGRNTSSEKMSKGDGKGSDEGKAMSVLSIDMGIRNLAYAHIIVPPGASSTKGRSTPQIPVINAWTRLAVSSFPSSGDTETSCLDSSPSTPAKEPKTRARKKSQPSLAEDQVNTLASGQNSGESPETKESFSPDLYASHAYTLITSLVAAYKPTHILIERQRFRSGGGSAVQEWTIRVGVFEGMLYAVLHTLLQQGQMKGPAGANSDADVVVQPVEPRRVARYWTEGDLGSPSGQEDEGNGVEKGEGEGKKKPAKTSRSQEGKKAKIDLVARWWLSYLEHQNSAAADTKLQKVCLAEDSQVRGVVDAYLQKWRGGKPSRKGQSSVINEGNKKKSATSRSKSEKDTDGLEVDEKPVANIKKLDDLADCLLQGIAWLEWGDMRRKIMREGLDAVSWLGASGSGGAVERAEKKPKRSRRKSKKE